MKQYKSLLIILIASLALRIGAIYPVHAEKYSSDEVEYIKIAQNLVKEDSFVDTNKEFSKRSPLFPFLLSYFFLLFGDNLLIPQIFNCLISTIAVLLIYILSIRLWDNKKIALYTAGAVAFYPGLIICAGMLQTENIYILFFLLSLLLAYKLIEQPRFLFALLLGVISALAALTRAPFFGFFPILLIIVWLIGKKNSLNISKQVIFSFIVYCLVLTPWTIRNYNLFGAFVPVSSWGGSSLLIGNNPFATGTWSVKQGFDDWFRQEALQRGINDISKLDEVQKNSLNTEIAVSYIQKNPLETIKIAIKKAHMFLIYPATHTDSHIPIQLTAVAFDFVLWIGVMLGISVLPKSRKSILLITAAILFFSLTQFILHAEARYRLPLIPLFCLYFGWGANIINNKDQLKELLSSKRMIIKASILIGIVILVYAYTGILFLQGSI